LQIGMPACAPARDVIEEHLLAKHCWGWESQWRTQMKASALLIALAGALLPATSASATASSPANDARAAAAATISTPSTELSARKKQRRHRYVDRGYRSTYGYDRPFAYDRPYAQGYYGGVQPGWGYGPDPGDRAWPPFHFKPYW
jgi:hypothetical protein